MLLHNQRSVPLTWEANGTEYKWEPYGSCEVPDKWLPHIRSQGLQVDVAAVPPREKAEIAAQAERESLASSELVKAQQRLAEAEARAAQAVKAAEVSSVRETKALELLEASEAKCAALGKQLTGLKSDVSEYEKLLSEATARLDFLEAERNKATKAAEKKPAPSAKQ